MKVKDTESESESEICALASLKSMQLSILIVDDKKDNLTALKAILVRDDVNIYQASSGKMALELVMKFDFCLALIDIQMPGMNGFELAILMRGSKRTKNIPIIFVTANGQMSDFSFKGYESGAVDFLIKPLDTHAVKSKVNIFIELHHQKYELIKAQQELNHAKNEAESANAAKTQFLAHMSHEIRTPIGAVLGFVELMKNPLNSISENLKYMDVVERNSKQLLRLIDEILDLSKVEAGMISIEKIQFSLAELLADFVSVMTLKAETKKIEFRLKLITTIPDIIFTDSFRMRQILNNIVGNAIKFTEKGFVELSIDFSNPTLRFLVKDTGVGILSTQESKLFHSFSQADSSITRKFGGTGLGLVLSRGLAELLGGKLEYIPTQDIGCVFSAEINCELLPEAKLISIKEINFLSDKVNSFKHSAKVLDSLKVLLVEDSEDNQWLISLYLQAEGAQVKFANNGLEGVQLALSDENFDIILMDIQMPIMDGHSAVKKLRRTQFTKPIIALTAHAMKEEHEKCIESGFNAFLTKPIQKDLLIKMLSSYKSKSKS